MVLTVNLFQKHYPSSLSFEVHSKRRNNKEDLDTVLASIGCYNKTL